MILFLYSALFGWSELSKKVWVSFVSMKWKVGILLFTRNSDFFLEYPFKIWQKQVIVPSCKTITLEESQCIIISICHLKIVSKQIHKNSKIKLQSFHNIKQPRESCFLYQIGSFSLLWSCNKSRSFCRRMLLFLTVWVMVVTIEHHFTTLYLQIPASGHLMFCPRNFYHLLLRTKEQSSWPMLKVDCFFSCQNYFSGIILVI